MITLSGVSKEYRGLLGIGGGRGVRALNDVSLQIAPGSALGVIGLNGAGKSTLLRVLLGYVRPSDGEVRIHDRPPRAYVERHGIAYVPERVAIPTHWTVHGALVAYAMLANLGEDATERVDAALARLGLQELAERRVGKLSKGNLQRLAIAQAILGEREIMVLDEPTDGLDPVWIAELRQIITEWRAADPRRILVMASHNLPEVQRIADHVLVLHDGRLLRQLEIGPDTEMDLEREFLSTVAEVRRGTA